MTSQQAKKIERIAKQIAKNLLTPTGGPEGHRLQIMERTGPRSDDERDLGGHCKASAIAVIKNVLLEHLYP